MIYLVDIDGTLADASHRLHWIEVAPKNWDKFFDEAVNDKPIWPVIRAVQDLAYAPMNVVHLVTGRSDRIRTQTEEWLRKNGIQYAHLHMRKDGDHRPDDIVKGEILDKILEAHPQRKHPTFNASNYYVAIEDRKRVVDMYRSRGIITFQVADGDF